MTPPKILICNYTPAEEKAWRFLLRNWRRGSLSPVPLGQTRSPDAWRFLPEPRENC